MFNLLYHLLLLIGAVPYLLGQRLFRGKYRHNLWERLGFRLPRLHATGDVIWFHAVSLGETRAAIPLYQELKRLYPDAQFVISSTTETGHEEAKRSLRGAALYFYLPLDLSWIMRKLMKRLHPRLLILVEGELWYNFLKAAQEAGARSFLVNGKMSERSFQRFQKFPRFSRRLLSCFEHICLQSQEFYPRFAQLGAQYLTVTGNLKYEAELPQLTTEGKEKIQKELGIRSENQIVVIGSSHAPEEEELLRALSPLWKEFPGLKVFLVPRHPDRFLEVEALLKEGHLPYITYSRREDKTGKERIFLVNEMGLLLQCYQLADVAIVAGSFTPRVGGHNVMEPAHYGVPVLFGLYMHTQQAMQDAVLRAQAGIQVSLEELPLQLKDLLQNPEKRRMMGKSGFRLVQSLRGAIQKTLGIIQGT